MTRKLSWALARALGRPIGAASGRPWRALVAVACVSVLFLAAVPAGAAGTGLHIELNKTEDNGGSCLASFVLRNELGRTLDRFSLDLYIFDVDGVIARQVLLDLAPLRKSKTTVARVALIEGSCAQLGYVLVNSIPSCRSEDGETLDCVDGLSVSSRSRIGLQK